MLCVAAGPRCYAFFWQLRVSCGRGAHAPPLAAAGWWRRLRAVPPPLNSAPLHSGSDLLRRPPPAQLTVQ